ncbi:hypothetical protein O181_018781 [Austropuccinia psidii MF-1]|uniref:Uncharacterized protein n=1 Tax=Austropuccinia psidii MF-1 TaxID=1389203 RepID=A0A9Q3GT90_9BASI|nr:hypothetical protein [Austropuccinia psidii MF-1]
MGIQGEPNPPNPSKQDTPVPCIPFKQTLSQPTPSLSGTQWSEDLFCAFPTTPVSIIIIDDTAVGSSTLTPVHSPEIPRIAPENPTASSPHSHDEALQEFTTLQQTLMIPQEIVHD